MSEVCDRSCLYPDRRAGCSDRASTLHQWLTANADLDRIDVELLAAHVLDVDRVRIVAYPDTGLTREQADRLDRFAGRLRDHEPLAYILGRKEFFGLDFQVGSDVLVPRPETELLVELAVQRAPRNARVADLGTGSGCIAVAIKTERPDLAVTATDISSTALKLARVNAAAADADVGFLAGDWFRPLGGPFDCIVVNPPYIAESDPALAALCREPEIALAGGNDGLAAIRHLIQQASPRMARPACLIMEHGFDQAGRVRALLAEHGFCDIETHRDLAGLERATLGCTGN